MCCAGRPFPPSFRFPLWIDFLRALPLLCVAADCVRRMGHSKSHKFWCARAQIRTTKTIRDRRLCTTRWPTTTSSLVRGWQIPIRELALATTWKTTRDCPHTMGWNEAPLSPRPRCPRCPHATRNTDLFQLQGRAAWPPLLPLCLLLGFVLASWVRGLAGAGQRALASPPPLCLTSFFPMTSNLTATHNPQTITSDRESRKKQPIMRQDGMGRGAGRGSQQTGWRTGGYRATAPSRRAEVKQNSAAE